MSSHSVMSDSLRPHGLQTARLLHPWDFPGKNTGVGCHFLLQGIFPTQGLNPGLSHGRQTLYCLSHQGCKQLKSCRVHLKSLFLTAKPLARINRRQILTSESTFHKRPIEWQNFFFFFLLHHRISNLLHGHLGICIYWVVDEGNTGKIACSLLSSFLFQGIEQIHLSCLSARSEWVHSELGCIFILDIVK